LALARARKERSPPQSHTLSPPNFIHRPHQAHFLALIAIFFILVIVFFFFIVSCSLVQRADARAGCPHATGSGFGQVGREICTKGHIKSGS